MSGVIRLLPESLANQIAAGEVIQRPASIVKELLENALDADSSQIRLIIKDAGKTSIQVVDNGSGMSENDARMCFERHATSKIESSDDLFNIRSFGFRGEALASIAAVAQIELKTKRSDAEFGTRIIIEGSKIKTQEPCQTPVGTSITIKNLFFNIPARRKFLKSDPVELKHILDEFIRIAIPYPDVFFTVHSNDVEIHHFPVATLRHRLVNYFGKNVNDKLIPVSEESEILTVNGFIGKPELIKKSRGDQYLFVNKRFIKSPYLNHAIRIAYESLISNDQHPMYVLMLDIDPETIDVNIHPTKQEIKFENERLIYNYLKVAVKHALGKYSLTPMIDFDEDMRPVFSNNPSTESYQGAYRQATPQNLGQTKDSKSDWLQFYKQINEGVNPDSSDNAALTISPDWENSQESRLAPEHSNRQRFFQLNDSYIICPIKSGMLVIDQHASHERILYEKNLKLLDNKSIVSQQNLFPETLELEAKYAEILITLIDDLRCIGFQIERLGQNNFIINSIPVEGLTETPSKFLENFVVSFTANLELQLGIKENIARSIAIHSSIKKGKSMEDREIRELIDKLFACEHPYTSPSGKKCFITLRIDELENRFKS